MSQFEFRSMAAPAATMPAAAIETAIATKPGLVSLLLMFNATKIENKQANIPPTSAIIPNTRMVGSA